MRFLSRGRERERESESESEGKRVRERGGILSGSLRISPPRARRNHFLGAITRDYFLDRRSMFNDFVVRLDVPLVLIKRDFLRARTLRGTRNCRGCHRRRSAVPHYTHN